MITIQQDAEMMTNLISANPVPAGSRFVAIKDENSMPAVFALGQDKKLNLIVNRAGVPTLVDFGSACKIAGTISAFDVRQETNLRVHVAVASVLENGNNQLTVAFDLDPSQLDGTADVPLVKSTVTIPTVHSIFMSDFSTTIGTHQIPLIFLAFQPTDRIAQEDQLGFIDVSANDDGSLAIALDTQWRLSTNPLRILDVGFISAPIGAGAAILYQSDAEGDLKLQFKTFRDNVFTAQTNAPPGSTCLASYFDVNAGSSVLVVGGQGVTTFTYADYTSSTSHGSPLPGSFPPGLLLKDVHVAQTPTDFTMWFTSSADGVYYFSASLANIASGTLTRLLPDGAGGQISGILSATETLGGALLNTLVSVNEIGDLSLLQQGSDTGMWEVQPFYAPSNANNISVQCFTVRLQAKTDTTTKDESVTKCQLFLQSSGAVQITANGVITLLSQAGAWYTTDANGTLTIVISTADMSCHTVQVQQFQSASGATQSINSSILNPASKVFQNLKSVTSGDDLLNAHMQDGKQLIPPGTVQKGDADNVATYMQQLVSTQTQAQSVGPSAARGKKTTTAGEAGALSDTQATVGQNGDEWGCFHFLYVMAEEVEDWVVSKVDGVWQMVLTFAGEVKTFVLDAVEKVGKAASWLMQKIKVGIEDLITWIGMFFDWGDILQTSKSIATFMDVGLQYGASQVASVQQQADAWMSNLRTAVQNKLQPSNMATSSNNVDTQSTTTSQQLQHGVGFNWSMYQMHHGGFATQGTVGAVSDKADATPEKSSSPITLEAIWASLQVEISKIESDVQNIANDIQNLLTTKTDTDQIYAKLGSDLITTALDTMQAVVDTILEALELILQKLGDVSSSGIQVPVFSALWSLITDGEQFSVINCLSLILAVPTTLLFKTVTGSPPPNLANRLTVDTFDDYINGKTLTDPTLARDIADLAGATVVGLTYVSMELTVITFVIDSVDPVSDFKTQALVDSKLGVGPVAGNVIDSATLILESLGLFFSWPLKFGDDQNLRWGSWGLDCSNAAVLAVSRLVGQITGIPRIETKRIVGSYEAISSIPTYILEIIVDVHELDLPDGNPEKDDGLVDRHIVEETFTMISAWAFGAAALSDGNQDEVTAVALVVMGLSMTITYAMKFTDFWISQTDKTTAATRVLEGTKKVVQPKETKHSMNRSVEKSFR